MASDFITGDALASSIGLTEGTSQNSTAGWLKFSLDSKTLYVAKRPFRYGISWNAINAVGAVFGTKKIVINGHTYKVRLLKGRGDGLTTNIAAGYDTSTTWNSEWNRLMYHVSGTPFANANNKLTSEGISVGDWAQYSEADLYTSNVASSGYISWCSDPSGSDKIVRAWYGVSYIAFLNSGSTAAWRPCLELIG